MVSLSHVLQGAGLFYGWPHRLHRRFIKANIFRLSLFRDIEGTSRENGRITKEWICVGYSCVVNGSNSRFAHSEKGQTTERSCWIAMVHPKGFATERALRRTTGHSDEGGSHDYAGALPTPVTDLFCYPVGLKRSAACDLPGVNLAAPPAIKPVMFPPACEVIPRVELPAASLVREMTG